jgi:hypothetical protein
MDLLALRELLKDLPDKTGLPYVTLSESVYKFNDFQPQQKHIPGTNELEPLRDAVIRDIQTAMHMQGSDPEFLERGPGLVAIVGVLEKYRLLFPNDNDFEYIIDELIATARGYYYDAGEKVSSQTVIDMIPYSRDVKSIGPIQTKDRDRKTCLRGSSRIVR